MIESSDDAIQLAILRNPEVFGLRGEDVNPLLRFTLEKADAHNGIPDTDMLMTECIDHCKLMIELKVEMVLSYRNKKSEPASTFEKVSEIPPPPKSDGGTNSQPANKQTGPKITIKQIRYIGYLRHQLGKTPDYKKVSDLTQKAATLLIKDLEKELVQAK